MSERPPVDLRSDTVTRPTPAMRRAMAEAIVGDDVLGDDPTVQRLEERIAELTGKQAALYVPSGTMGNQLAIHCQTEPGDEILLEAESHMFLSEQGGPAANSGCLTLPLRGSGGAITPADVRAAFGPEDDHVARVRCVCIENTHSRSGGTVVPLAVVDAVATAARQGGARVHIDGARLWNVEAATGIPLARWAGVGDTVMMCFSKGLGAPVGSILTGSAEVIRKARRVRKRWGGGMRQVGVLAAAALHALDHHVERLADDHRRARRLADRLRQPGFEVAEPETNIVIVRVERPETDCDALIRSLAERGVLMSRNGAGRLRAITHLDVDDAQIEHAGDVFRDVVSHPAASLAGGR